MSYESCGMGDCRDRMPFVRREYSQLGRAGVQPARWRKASCEEKRCRGIAAIARTECGREVDLEGASQIRTADVPEVRFEALMKRVAGARLFLGWPIIGKMKAWNCNFCEHQWGIEDEKREESPKPL